MAELKQNTQYSAPVGVPNPEEHIISPEVQPVPPLKKSRGILRKITWFEKTVAFLLILGGIGLAAATIQVRTAITKRSEEVSTVENEIIKTKEEISKLEQEKSELSRYDRLKKIAEDAGLKPIEENIRKVTP